MTAFILVGAGAAAGAMARYGVAQWALAHWGSGFPWGTLAVNITGSLLIGVLAVTLAGRGEAYPRLLLMTGLLGGYTTFSAYSFETLALLTSQRWAAAMAYAGGSVLAGLLACGAGYALALRVMQ